VAAYSALFLAKPNFFTPTMWQAFFAKATPNKEDKDDNRETAPLTRVA
jgi:hypothetical protein